MEKENGPRVDKAVAGLIIGGVAVTILFTVLFMGYVRQPAFTTNKIDPAIFGQYGDVLGGVVGTLLGFLSVYLLYLTYTSQKEELKQTRIAFKAQKMDSAFFNLLMILENIRKDHDHGELLKELKDFLANVENGDKEFEMDQETGQLAPYKYNIIEEITETDGELVSVETMRQEISIHYLDFYEKYPGKLSHYFRYIYNVIKYIRESELTKGDEIRYIGLLKAQLSSDELGLIFYNAMSIVGKNGKGELKFMAWLDEYGFLENIDPASLKELWHHWFYPRTEFKFLDEEYLEERRAYVKKFLTPVPG